MSILGFVILPTALEMSAEVAYPFSAALSSGLLWMGAHAVSVLVGVILDFGTVDFSEDVVPRFIAGRWLLLTCLAVAAILWWLFPVRCALPLACKVQGTDHCVSPSAGAHTRS